MKLPSAFYGRYAAVVPACRKAVKQMVKAGRFDLFDPEPFIETSETPGFIYLDKSPPWRAEESHFHCGVLTRAVIDTAERQDDGGGDLLERWVAWSVQEPWRFLGLMEQGVREVQYTRPSLHRPLIDAAVRFWPIVSAEGSRFTTMDDPKDLWELAGPLKYALGNELGISVEDLIAPLPPGGVEELVRRAETRRAKTVRGN